MKKSLLTILAAAALTVSLLSAEDTRTIRLIQDDAQVKMVTKIYYLKNLKASDVGIFVQAAVRRYAANSQVRCLNFSANKQQALIVTTADEFIPYVDQIVGTLDRGTKRDANNSSVYGVGYRWKFYEPRFRTADKLLLPAFVMLSCNGNAFANNGNLWVKDDLGDIDYTLDWVRYFDRPLPQARITVRYYAIRESDLRDVGIDYLAWKNGPGLNLASFAYNDGSISWSKVFNMAADVGSSLSWGYGGAMVAPAFDMSFIRILQQSGEAKVVASADVTVTNNYPQANVSLVPTYNGITKDPEEHTASVRAFQLTDMTLSITQPQICFFAKPEEVNEYGWIPADKKFYDRNQGNLVFGYSLISNDSVEANNYGTQIASGTDASSSCKTINFGREHLLANGVREYDVEQTTGVPFLCNLPVLKYIFGTTTTIKEKIYTFVTVEAKLVYPADADAAVAAK